jgi:hypothetical protein
MIVLGLILPSLVPTFAFAHLVVVLGVILLVIGLILFVTGRAGHAVGGAATTTDQPRLLPASVALSHRNSSPAS